MYRASSMGECAMTDADLREQVRERYAAAATAVTLGGTNSEAVEAEGCCGPSASESGSCCSAGSCAPESVQVDDTFGVGMYSVDEQDALPPEALAASLGCGNPLAVAELRAGERVLDLGSGGGIDVLLSARRVGETGFAYGVDMTDEMLALARTNAEKAGASNVEFVKGTIEDVPLPDGAVDVVISNCVINLSTDKPAVFREAARVLRPGGRFAVTDIVADPGMDEETRRDMAQWTGCIAGALTEVEFRGELEVAGFEEVQVRETHRVHDQAGSAIIRARVPA